MSRDPAHDLWRRFVNPDLVKLLETLGFSRRFVRAEGTKLFDEAGIAYTDFLAGFGVHNVGHNPPRLVAALRAVLDSGAPSMLNIDAPLEAGLLAERLTRLTHPDLCRTTFANSGAEAADIAIKAARAATGRTPLLACQGGYHGLSPGSLSLMGDEAHRAPFGPLLPEVDFVPFGDAAALEAACARLRPAAFFVEPIQGEGGIRVPEPSYLAQAARICRANGCLLVADEIQTGLGRTGTNFATPLENQDSHTDRDCPDVPDILLVGKALSGGLVPVAAAMMTASTWDRAFSGPARCVLNSSTFAGGRLAMAAGIETLSILEDEQLAARSRQLGDELMNGLRGLADKHPIIKAVRGRGLFAGIEFQAPSGLFVRAVPRWARDGLYTQVICALLLREHRILAQPCSLSPAVLRIEPPLVITGEEIAQFVAALDATLAACPSHNSAAVAAFRKSVLGWDL